MLRQLPQTTEASSVTDKVLGAAHVVIEVCDVGEMEFGDHIILLYRWGQCHLHLKLLFDLDQVILEVVKPVFTEVVEREA
jgi:hypothetical protein